jgi:hypothetical protein
MAYAVVSQSSITLTGSYQTIGAAVTTGKLTTCELDLTNMVNGDEIEIAAYVKTTSGGAAVEVLNTHIVDAQFCDAYQTPVLWAPYSIEYKAKQTAGTGRNVPYVIFTID